MGNWSKAPIVAVVGYIGTMSCCWTNYHRRSFDSWMTDSQGASETMMARRRSKRQSVKASSLDASADNGFVLGFTGLFATKSTGDTSNTVR